jgi:hypothetical protein
MNCKEDDTVSAVGLVMESGAADVLAYEGLPETPGDVPAEGHGPEGNGASPEPEEPEESA